MRIEIEIPKEFEEHFKQDRFEDTLHRLSADAHLLAGNYEQETAIMLIKAFKESKTAYNIEKVVEELEKRSKEYNSGVRLHGKPEEMLTHEAIDIVKRGGVE